MRGVFADGFEKLIAVLARAAPEKTRVEKRKRSIALFSEIVGAMVLARAVGEPTLAAEILQIAKFDVISRHD